MRVGYVLNVFPKTSETFIAGELAELRWRGVEVRILSLRPPADEPRHEVVERAGLLERTFYDEGDYRQALAALRPDLLHAHFAVQATAKARELAAELDIPFTFTTHAYDIYRDPPADLARRVEASAAMVTVSEANARHLERTFGIPRERIRVIPCGIDVDHFRPGDLPRPQPPAIVCVARLVPAKNHELLLRACALLRDRGVAFRCLLVGDGRSRADVEGLRSELGLASLVEIAGSLPQDEVLALWRRAAVGTLSSDSEGAPMSLMEAAACGVPVVATAVAGVPELVEDGVTGFVVPPRDAPALAGALERLLSDPALVARMGAAARRRAEERFSVKRHVDALTALWDEVLAR